MAGDVKPIRSEADYEAAMAEVETLWGAANGTPEGDRLDVLAALIDAYEAKHDQMDLPDPVEAIKFRMEQMSRGTSRIQAQANGAASATGWASRSPRTWA